MNFLSSSDINKETIDQIVHEMVKNNGIKWIPDWIERKIYTNVIYLVMQLCDSLLQNTQFMVFGHEVEINITPPKVPERLPERM